MPICLYSNMCYLCSNFFKDFKVIFLSNRIRKLIIQCIKLTQHLYTNSFRKLEKSSKYPIRNLETHWYHILNQNLKNNYRGSTVASLLTTISWASEAILSSVGSSSALSASELASASELVSTCWGAANSARPKNTYSKIINTATTHVVVSVRHPITY